MPVVTLSASFGSGGSAVGPMLAERLGATFADRAIPTSVAEQMAVPLEHALARDESTASRFDRLMLSFASVGAYGPLPTAAEEHAYRDATEAAIRRHAESGNAVILGRAGMIVLKDDPTVLKVRLHGPEAARIRLGMELLDLSREESEKTLRRTDRARDAYIRNLYGADPDDPCLYHLMLDGPSLGPAGCVEVILATAAQLQARLGDATAA
jgi:cytidylate kinase